jgi:hypothetical protein
MSATYEKALIPRSRTVPAQLTGQDDLTQSRLVAQRLVAATETGTRHGTIAGVEAAVLPGCALAYLIPFLLGLLWGLVLGLLSLVGAALYGLRCLGSWLCKR